MNTTKAFKSTGRLIASIVLSLTFNSCSGQGNPKYLDAKLGAFDLEKITFNENLDTLFSKQEKFYKMPKPYEATTPNTLYTLYRIPARSVKPSTFKFKNLIIKPNEVVDFYADEAKAFRKAEVSVYLNNQQYADLINSSKSFKNIIPVNVNKVNNGKYIILQDEDAAGQIQTTLYCLNNKDSNDNDKQRNYFVRISKFSLKKKGDKFYQQFNDDIK